MARLSKRELFEVLERAVVDGGWRQLRLSPAGQHPARYAVHRDPDRFVVRVYIWNLTPGGRNRPADEWRVQATGIDAFEQEIGGKTAILGWQDEREVLVGFDCRRHLGPVGSSPSIQIREDALDRAAVDGFAVHNRGNDELAVAFRPDFLPAYIASLDSLHDCGQVEGEIALLQELARDAARIEDADVAATVAQPRRYAIIATRRALRQLDFRGRVLSAYRHSCAMCGMQLELLDAAHILPAAHPNSTDDTSNGVALCVLHHRAFDRSLVTFDAAYRTYVNEAGAVRLRAADRAGGLPAFREALRPVLGLPADRRDRPAAGFVAAANESRGWRLL